MLQRERLEQIRQLVRKKREVSVSELSKQYSVTEETIRRDLDKLKNEGLVSRTYGGAVLAVESVLESVDYLSRAQTHSEEKMQIGRLVSSVIPPKATIGADASSTVMSAIDALSDRSEITLLTNSVRALTAAEQFSFRLMCTGGEVNRYSYSLQGPRARTALDEYFLDIVLIGCKALNLDGGVFDSNEEEALWKKRLIERGSKVFLLADHSKFNKVAFVQITRLEKLDMVITDRSPDREWLERLKEWNVKVLWPGAAEHRSL